MAPRERVGFRIRLLPSLRTGASLFNPRVHLFRKLLVAHLRDRPSIARVPAPQHKGVLVDMIDNLVFCPAAVLLRVFQLAAEFPGSAPLEGHGHVLLRHVPIGGSGRPLGLVCIPVAQRAFHRPDSLAVGPAFDVEHVGLSVVLMQR